MRACTARPRRTAVGPWFRDMAAVDQHGIPCRTRWLPGQGQQREGQGVCPPGSVLGKALSAAGSVQPLLTAGSSAWPPKGCVLTARAGGEGPDAAGYVAGTPWSPSLQAVASQHLAS